MSWTDLRTDYTDAQYQGLRKYTMINNGDNTVSFEDQTEYTQEENSFFSASDANAMNAAVNAIMHGLNIAAPFSSGTVYSAGDYCFYDGVLYRFTAAHTGTWDAGDVLVVLISTELQLKIEEAPSDGKIYGRKDGEWEELTLDGSVWGNINGTLANQTDLQNALNAKANTADLGTMATVNDAPSNGSEYVRKNGAWAVSSGGGGGGSVEAVSVYVNGVNGSDSNTGSQASPFATIGKAVSTVPVGAPESSYIYIAGGTYSGNVTIINKRIVLRLQADVRIVGDLYLYDAAYLHTGSGAGTLQVTGCISLDGRSYMQTASALYVSTFATNLAISLSNYSVLNAMSPVEITNTYTSGGKGIYAASSSVVCLGTISVSAEIGLEAVSGGIISYGTLNGIMTTQTSEASGGRVYTGASSSGGAAWGSITGTLSDQTDLNTALSGKQNTLTFDSTPTSGSTNPVTSGGVSTALAAKADSAELGSIATANYTISTTDLTDGTSPLTTGDLYFYYEV